MICCHIFFLFFFFNDTATTEIYTLSLHDALPILEPMPLELGARTFDVRAKGRDTSKNSLNNKRSEEHTSELQSRLHLVCRLLLEKKKKITQIQKIRCDYTRTRERQV